MVLFSRLELFTKTQAQTHLQAQQLLLVTSLQFRIPFFEGKSSCFHTCQLSPPNTPGLHLPTTPIDFASPRNVDRPPKPKIIIIRYKSVKRQSIFIILTQLFLVGSACLHELTKYTYMYVVLKYIPSIGRSLKFLCKMCVHVTRLASAPIVKGGTPN